MASEITYAEVKFKNASPAAVVKGKERMLYSGQCGLEGGELMNRKQNFFLLRLSFPPSLDKSVRIKSWPLDKQETGGLLK